MRFSSPWLAALVAGPACLAAAWLPAQTPTPAPTQAAAAEPTPTPTPTPARPVGRLRNILEAEIGDVFLEGGLPATARLAVYVANLNTGEPLADLESDQPRAVGTAAMVATGAAALERLGPDHRWTTTLDVSGAFVEGTRTFKGYVLLCGGGDPSFLARTSTDRQVRLALLDDWARALHAFGIRRLDGRVVGDDTRFEGPGLGPGWEPSESAEWWMAEVRALTLNDGVLELDWRAPRKPGAVAKAKPWPGLDGLEISSNLLVAQPGESPRPVRQYRHAIRTEYHVTGSVEPDARLTTLVTVDDPARWAAERLRVAMRRAGIRFENPAPATRAMLPAAEWPAPEMRIQIARHDSAPLAELLPRVLRDGHPLYAECLLRALAIERGLPASFTGGDEALTQWATETGVARQTWLMADGSGLSPSTRLSARELAEVVRRAAAGPTARVFVDSLAVAGQPGTLANAHARQLGRLRGIAGIHRTGAATVGLLEGAAGGGRHVVVVVLDEAGEAPVVRRDVVDSVLDVIDDAIAARRR